MWKFSTTPDGMTFACADQPSRLIADDLQPARRSNGSVRPPRTRLGRADTGVGNGWEFETARPSTESHSDGEYLVSTVMFLEGGT
jgi:hypothetical protein